MPELPDPSPGLLPSTARADTSTPRVGLSDTAGVGTAAGPASSSESSDLVESRKPRGQERGEEAGL